MEITASLSDQHKSSKRSYFLIDNRLKIESLKFGLMAVF